MRSCRWGTSLPVALLAGWLCLSPLLGGDTVPEARSGEDLGDTWIPEPLKGWMEGVRLLEAGRYDEGLEWTLDRHRELPDNACGYFFVALMHLNYGVGGRGREERLGLGRQALEQGLELASESKDADPAVRYCLGGMYGLRAQDRLENGSYLGGAFDGKRFRRVMLDLIEDHPSFVDCRFWLGTYDYYGDVLPTIIKFFRTLLFLPSGDRDRGIEALEEVVERGVLDRYNAFWVLLEVYEAEGRGDDKLKLLERFHESYPEAVVVALALARHHAASRPQRAVELHRELVERLTTEEGSCVPGVLIAVRHSLGRLHMTLSEPDSAVQVLQEVLHDARGDRERELSVAINLAQALNHSGRHREAVGLLGDIEERYPTSARLPLLRRQVLEYDEDSSRAVVAMLPAARLARDGKTAEALVALRDLLSRPDGAHEARFRIAELLFQEERLASAEAHYLRIVADLPEFPRYLVAASTLRLGQVCDRTDRRRAAKNHYRRAIEMAGSYDQIAAAARRFAHNRYGRSPEE